MGKYGIILVRWDQLKGRKKERKMTEEKREKNGSAGSCIIRTAITSLRHNNTELNSTVQYTSRHLLYALEVQDN